MTTKTASCEVTGCERPIRARSLCALHYDRWIKHGRKPDLGPVEPLVQRARGEICGVPECARPVRCKMLCASHYDKARKTDTCHCGKPKLERSLTCRACHDESFGNTPDRLIEKVCPKCRETKPIGEFSYRKTTTGRTKLRSRCRTCASSEARTHRQNLKTANPELYQARRTRAGDQQRELWRTDPERWLYRALRASARNLGVSFEAVCERLEHVGNVCEACGWQGQSEPGKRVHIDHCHETGEFRGLLCGWCNAAAGLAGDCPNKLRGVADYLIRRDPLI